MQNRLMSQKLKMGTMTMLFEREIKNMKVYCFGRIQINRFKTLALSLSTIKKTHIQALIRQYYSMCKMVYRIRSVAAYTWDKGATNLDSVSELYNEDSTFIKMVQIVKNNMINLFTDTDPDKELIGDNTGERQIRITRILDV